MICAWCGIEVGRSPVVGSHGICPPCYERLLGIPHLTTTELDALPFGVIELDPDGTVLTYNRSEQRLSGRAAREVVGRNFFTDVAPCTRVKEFQGRFRSFLAASEGLASFSFVFPFPSGAVKVRVSFVRSDRGGGFVIVTREMAGPAAATR